MAGMRRTWDKELYAAKAKDRLESGGAISAEESSKPNGATKEEFLPASKDSSGPMGSERAFIRARQEKVDLESKVGRTEIINPTAENCAGPGYFCQVCNCLLKDSVSYLDHINGKKHQRALGFSMRVERSGVDQVKERLESLKRKVQEKSKNPIARSSAVDEYELRLTSQQLEVDALKKKKKEDKALKKLEEEEALQDQLDPEIAALMGFSSFECSKK